MESLKTQVRRRWEDLKTERSSWMPHWREISEVLLPRSGRFLPSGNNKGNRNAYRAILDNTGTRALRTLSGRDDERHDKSCAPMVQADYLKPGAR